MDTFIIGRAYIGMGDSPSILANAATEPTFHDFIDIGSCISDNSDYLEEARYVHYRVIPDMCIITAQPQITLTTGETKYFLRWDIGNLDEIKHKWYHRELPVHKGMDPICVAVYGLPYVEFKAPLVNWLDLSLEMSLKN